MSKIVLTQKQFQEITKRLTEEKLSEQKETINEGYGDEYYEMECNVDIEYYGTNFKGNEINDVTGAKMRVTYHIDVEARSWGIKDISLYGISGPTEYEIEVNYYTSDDNEETETINLNLDWENIVKDEESGQGVISVGQTVTLTLENDENGNLICNQINVPVYTL
jgi:hypothetical protein